MTSLKIQLEQQLGLSLNQAHSVLILSEGNSAYEHLYHLGVEDGVNLLLEHEFNLVSLETKRFLVLVELYIAQYGYEEFYNLGDDEEGEEDITMEAWLFAGRQLNFYNPSKPIIKALEEHMEVLNSLYSGDGDYLEESILLLREQLLTDEEEEELLLGQYQSDSHSDDAYEASWNGAED